MWCKAVFFDDIEIANEILVAPTSQDAKKLGRKVQGYDDTKWAEVRYQYMLDVNLCKFQQNSELKFKLLSLGTKHIVEANLRDLIWSCGVYPEQAQFLKDSEYPGQNLLSKVLMEIRTLLSSVAKV
jgi:ribA/ribD-fused uncharacterized protein